MYKDLIYAYADAEKAGEWRRWAREIPYISLDPRIRFKPIPPFVGAIARFCAEAYGKEVSIYLDCYDILGCVGKPYWEVFPVAGDTARFPMHDICGLAAAIKKELLGED